MNIFDFDNTLYHGESPYDFVMFIIKKEKTLWKYIPGILLILFRYKICNLDIHSLTESLEKYIEPFLQNKGKLPKYMKEFWEENIGKLDVKMLKKVTKNDAIITTSPSFLLKEIQDVLPTKNLICTEINIENGKIEYLNFQENKVKNFKKHYPKKKIENFYTDSYNDAPLMDISSHVYLVKKGKCTKIK